MIDNFLVKAGCDNSDVGPFGEFERASRGVPNAHVDKPEYEGVIDGSSDDNLSITCPVHALAGIWI